MSALDCLRFMLHVLIQKDSKRRTKIAPPRSAEAFNPYRRSKKGSGQKRMKLTPQNLKLLKPMVEGSKKYSRRTIPY